ncbi:hypothetical protein OBBRIDRAFT_823287 [Obba rivulosa]|uniref:DNA replication regulator SLD2 n=1 Tax=Obba rivulosa TaxID=1052685 RepID=A0A8E2DS73_9APHY|nr:hypothetical protein OBBRIDRAFT_823287 [Obba rivulosa]
MDASAVRAEIKAWERDFRAKHGRDPSIQEIRDQPTIAAKYKLYKSLKSSAVPSTQPLPSTPSRSSLLPKSRPVKIDPPAITANPFSPSKSKSKRDIAAHAAPLPALTRPNPFATPTKPKTKSAARRPPSPEEDFFPSIEPLVFPTAPRSTVASPQLVDRAVTRARKRLRGEPVSPSPVKEKRIRTAASIGPALRFPPPDALSDSDDGHRTQDDDVVIEATPAKPRPGGKQFHMLFDEPPAGDMPATSRAKSVLKQAVLFKSNKVHGRATSPVSEEEDWSMGINGTSKVNALDVSAPPQPKRPLTANVRSNVPRALRPSKNDLYSAGPSRPQSAQPAKISGTPAALSSAKKRPLSSDAPATAADGGPEESGPSQPSAPRNSFLRLPLLPPSPPPSTSNGSSSTKYANKGKAKAQAAFSRKKARLLEETAGGKDADATDDESLEDDESQVKVVEHRWYRTSSRPDMPEDAQTEGAGSEPELGWWTHPDPDDGVEPERGGETETTMVSLPDNLRRILALSDTDAREREREREEARMVRGLLYGKGGVDGRGAKVWGVGEGDEEEDPGDDLLKEVSGSRHGVDDEDDWEGEPVPWQVGEL